MIQIGWIRQSRNGEPDRCQDLCVTSRLLEAYDPSLVDRHMFRSQCQSLNYEHWSTNTFVSPFKDLLKSALWAHSMYNILIQSIIFESECFVFCSLYLSPTLHVYSFKISIKPSFYFLLPSFLRPESCSFGKSSTTFGKGTCRSLTTPPRSRRSVTH